MVKRIVNLRRVFIFLLTFIFLLALGTPAFALGNGVQMYNGNCQYSRVIRLSDGTLLACFTIYFSDTPNDQAFRFYKSVDNGETFTFVSEFHDTAEPEKGICANTIIELPSQLGDFPAGTILLGYTVADFYDVGKGQKCKIQASFDRGATWSYVSTLEDGTWNWEPEFTISADGKLQCYYSFSPDYYQWEQYIVRKESSDGITWSPRIQAIGDKAHGCGMVRIIKISDNKWAEVVESYNVPGYTDTVVRMKFSDDGKNWGDVSDLGHMVRAASGKYMAATPAFAWIESPQYPKGIFAVMGWNYRNVDGSAVDPNGQFILYNTNDGAGDWHEMEAPFKVNYGQSTYVNYSASLLPLSSDKLFFISQSYGENGMGIYYETGPVGAAPIGKTVWIKAANGNYLSARADLANAPLRASISVVDEWERYQVVDGGWGCIALKAMANQNYVNAWVDEEFPPLAARGTAIDDWERFYWQDNGGGNFTLLSFANRKYVSARIDQSDPPVEAMAYEINAWEKFQWGES